MKISTRLFAPLFYVSFVFGLTGCAPEGDDPPADINARPVADAGTYQVVVEDNPVLLDGSGSSDGDGDPLTYLWSVKSGPTGQNAVFSDTTIEMPVFTPDIGGIYMLSLVVSDGKQDSLAAVAPLTTLTQLTTDGGNDAHAYYSPDGNQITWSSDRAGNADVWVMNADGSAKRQFTFNPASELRPHWSALGSHIIFQSSRNGNEDLYVKLASLTGPGGGFQVTQNTANDTRPAWNPVNDLEFAFEAVRSGNTDIRLRSIGISGSVAITSHPDVDSHPMWSPDGARIAFTRRVGGEGDIWIMNADGSSKVQITNTPGVDEQHTDWSPDGLKLAYRSNQGGDYNIWTINVDGSSPTQITVDAGADQNPDWHPDGTKIMFRSDRSGNNDIYVYPLTP